MVSLANYLKADYLLFVNQVLRRPESVVVGPPVHMVVVHYHRVGNVQPLYGFLDVLHLFLKREFEGVISDDDKTFVLDALVPRARRRDLPDAVNTAEGPHHEQDNFPLEALDLEGAAVEPGPRRKFRNCRAGIEA